MTDANEYDVIFAALKHPLRRRVLLLLDEKGEISFTDIQKAVAMEDTGLMSYHLKELDLLLSKSARGRYSLSEIGKTSVALLKKVERSRNTSRAVRRELGRLVGEVLGFLSICAVAWLAATSVDIHASVQLIYDPNITPMVGVYALGILAMFGSVALFTLYDRYYFSKVLRQNILHSILFALIVVLSLIPSEYMTYRFTAETTSVRPVSLQHSAVEASYGLLVLIRTVFFVVGSPFIAYLTCKLAQVVSKRET